MLRVTHFIDGRFQELADANTPAAGLPITNPARAEVIGGVAAGDAATVDAAVAAARRALPSWRSTAPAERAAVLRRLAALIERDIEPLARAESENAGKPITLAREVEVPRAAHNFRFFADAAERFDFEEHLEDAGSNSRSRVVRSAAGVAGCISPWNLPLYLFTWKIAPALAAGCTVVAKPSEVTPVTAWMLCALAQEAGLPSGVLNVVHGRGDVVGAAIVRHPEIPVLSFTGSTAVGEWIAREAAPHFKKVALEMGGKNAAVILADADLPRHMDEIARSCFRNQGQICLCTSRLLVHESRRDELIDGLVQRARALRVGDPLEASTELGSLVGEAHQAKVMAAIDQARAGGATVHCGGGKIDPSRLPTACAHGCFVAPTVLSGLGAHSPTNREEVFGPVVTVQSFATEAQAIELANDSSYGLAASVWTEDAAAAARIANQLEVGIVWTNCWMVRDLRTPFGGAKRSGLGREGGEEALRHFTEPKSMTIRR